jgi:hypothetical protein
MTNAYVKMMDDLEAAGIRTMRDHYDFSRDALDEEYDSFFEYSTTHMKKKEKDLGYPTCYLYIRNDPTINAYAASTPTYKIIGFHHGCFERLYSFFNSQEDLLNDPEYGTIKSLLARLGNDTIYSFFQYYMMFLYYHEFAHLVQGSRTKTTFYLQEYATKGQGCTDILYCHAREMDSDWLACNACGIMVGQFFLDEQNNFNGTGEELTTLATVALTAIFCYFLIAAGYNQEIYFEAEDHPHPFVRISYVAEFLAKVIAGNKPDSVKFDANSAVGSALELSERMLSSTFPNALPNFKQAFTENKHQIEEYVNKIIDRAIDTPELCMNQSHDILF